MAEVIFCVDLTLLMRTRRSFSEGMTILFRHGRACAGHPCLCHVRTEKTWMAGPSPAMTDGGISSEALREVVEEAGQLLLGVRLDLEIGADRLQQRWLARLQLRQ